MNLKKINLIKQRAWNSTRFPFDTINKSLKHVPTLLSVEEKKMLNWICRQYVTGAGQVCDLGSFLGGSTIQLANGLKHNGSIQKLDVKVHSYDRFMIDENIVEKWIVPNKLTVTANGDTLKTVQKMLKDYSNVIYNQGDFLEQIWINKPIEILFIDIAKTWALSDHIVKQFFTHLIPNHSIVVQQDMLFVNCPWICAVMFALRDHFEFLSATEKYSALFLCTKEIKPFHLEYALHKNFEAQEILQSIDFFIHKMNYYPHIEVLRELKRRVKENPTITKSWELK